MELQELISRARLLFDGFPKRLEVFELVNGKRSNKELAVKTGKTFANTLTDLSKMKALELIITKKDVEGKVVLKDNSPLYEKNPLIDFLSSKYFKEYAPSQGKLYVKKVETKGKHDRVPSQFSIPSETEILDICRNGEDQRYEFKSQGTDVQKLTKEISAFANTRSGGLILYGVADDGSIHGTDVPRAEDLISPFRIRSGIRLRHQS